LVTLSSVLATTARRAPERTALVDGDRRQSYAEFDAAVNRAACVLVAGGMDKGDRLALMSFNTEGFVLTFYAAMRIGVIVVPVNPRMAVPEVTYILDDSGAKALVFDPALAQVAGAARAGAAQPPAIFMATEPVSSSSTSSGLPSTGVEDLLTLARSQDDSPSGVVVAEADDAEILYTSGTTGRPKGVLLDQHRVVWDGVNICLATGMCDGERLLHVAPLYHSAELNLFLNGGMLIGATHVLVRNFEPVSVIDTLEREKITSFFGVPTMYQLMLDCPQFTTSDLSSWRIGMFGAAPMPPATIEQLAAAVPAVRLFNLCGPTEAGPGGIFLPPEQMLTKLGANGRALVNTEARVVDAAGVDVSAGATGEVVLRGETIMKEYWHNPEATAEALHDGWLHTGDVGRIDEDGYITLVDRMKDMIITGGMNVYTVEVENALAAHPDIVDAAVVGKPHPLYGESIVAVVTFRPGCEHSLEEIRAHVKTLIADYKAPHELVVGDVPRNPSGKIVKHLLRDRFREA